MVFAEELFNGVGVALTPFLHQNRIFDVYMLTVCHSFGPYQTNFNPKTPSATSEVATPAGYNHKLGLAGQLNLRIGRGMGGKSAGLEFFIQIGNRYNFNAHIF